MGKITDAAIALFVIIIGFFILYRLGITLPLLEHVIKQFFSPSSPAVNSTSGFILPLMLTNSRIREKARRRIENLRRILKLRSLRGTEIRSNKGDFTDKR